MNFFEADITIGLDNISEIYDNYVVLGDLNFDMLEKSKACKLENVYDVFDLSNVIKESTCFTSGNKPSLVHLILINSTSYIGKTFNFGCGLSDVHNLIGVQLKFDIPLSKPRWRTYRSLKNFDVENFNCDLNERLVDLNLSGNKDVSEMYETFTSIISEVTDKYAPLKKKKCLSKLVPYMNKFLKQAVYKKESILTNIKITYPLAIRKIQKSKEILSLN